MFRIALSRRRTAVIHRCAAGVAGIVIGGAYASGQNLLLDPGFEAGIAGAPSAAAADQPMQSTPGGAPTGPWLGWNNWVYPYSGYYTTSVTPHSGTQVGKTFSGQNGGIYQYAAVTGGEAYTASAWFDNSSSDALELGQTCDVRMIFFSGPNGTGANLGTVVTPTPVSMATPNDTWTQLMVQAAAPATAVSVQWMAFFYDPLYTGGAMFVDDTSLLDTSWDGQGADNNWSTNNNWGGVAPGQYAPLVFAGNQRLNNTNDMPAATPFYGIEFQPSAGAFTLNGNQVNLASDVVNNSTNTQTIALPLGLQQDTNFNTAAGNITVTGAISGAFALNKIGSKTLTLGGANTYGGGTNVSAGRLVIEPTSPTTSALPAGPLSISGSAVVQLADNATAGTALATSNINITSLTLAGNGTLDIGNNRIIIDYTPGNDPIAQIATWIKNGFYGIPGPAITSSDIAADDAASGLSYGIGYADGADNAVAGLPTGEIEIMFTLLGDANLDGTVNSEDFTPFSTNLGLNGGWDQGDFNYDGTVNSEDFTPFSSNLNQSATFAAAAGSIEAADGISLANVPEPACGTLLLVGVGSLLGRHPKAFGIGIKNDASKLLRRTAWVAQFGRASMSVSLEILASRNQLSRFEGFLSLDGQEMYRISGHDQLEPFLITLCTESDLWMYLSSTGGVTAGRIDSDHTILPYETEDRLHRAHGISGPCTLLRVTRRGGSARLWEPFSPILFDGPIERNLYKSALGSRVTFEEVNHDLELVFRYSWVASTRFGFVRSATLLNSRNSDVRVELLDGLLNVMPAGVPMNQQIGFSCLVDAYKRCEIDEATGLAIYSLTSIITDRPEAAESLTANTLWTRGLDASISLDERAVEAFRRNSKFTALGQLVGRRGAFLLRKDLDLVARQRVDWVIAADAARDHAAVADTRLFLREPTPEIQRRVADDVKLSEEGLSRIVAEVDGLQLSDDRMTCARHATNTLFNAMRGGAPQNGGRFSRADFSRFVRERNKILWQANRDVVDKLPEHLTVGELIAAVSASHVPDLLRLAYEYLPLTFSRRHGDPSRPWNRFAIRMRDEAGNPCVSYEGNWRDIFQNWEALGLAYPDLFDSFIAKFLSASTVDGFNPYRVTSEGIDWEIPDPANPWSHIGYWGDHQIVYLFRLLEWSVKFHPQRLRELIGQPIFSYANVPYRLDSYRAMTRNPRQTIRFDTAEAARIDARVKLMGADGRLLLDDKGNVYLATLLEKLLVPLLTKICNLIPGGGIWMNTQRPEWNDANNALAGAGVSVVTLAYFRRHIAFLLDLLRPMRSQAVDVSSEVVTWAERVFIVLSSHSETLDQSTVSPENRRALMDDLGEAFEDYRHGVYTEGFSGKHPTSIDQILELLELALRHADHTLAANWRSDGLAHSYNILDLTSGDRLAYVRRLDEMLEGQVAFLSSGMLGPAKALSLLSSMFNSRLYREDQQSFMLYPIRELTGFLQRNIVSPDAVRANPLLSALVESGDRSIVARDADGIFRFSGYFRNRADVQQALSRLETDQRWEHLVAAQTTGILKLFDDVFGHEQFNGRSERMYAYEGIGCVYWHMVSKLMLAAQECFWTSVDAGAAPHDIEALAQSYYDIRAGLGLGKTAAEYGAFPTDPYSHTPLARGAAQPGMTGRVKEEMITRLGEWGLRVRAGQICFDPRLFRRSELLSQPAVFSCFALDGSRQAIDLTPGMAAFTFAQVPIVYSTSASDQAVITITHARGGTRTVHGSSLSKDDSAQIFSRTGAIIRVGFEFPARLLRMDK